MASKYQNYGIVYVLTNPAMPDLVKIGMTNRDNVDARMNMLTKALDQVKEGEWTGRVFALENRSFYKPKE